MYGICSQHKTNYIHKVVILYSLFKVSVMDVDICGPSAPRIMGVEGETVHQSGSGWSPVVSFMVFKF